MAMNVQEVGPVEQMRRASKNANAALLGAALGGFVPAATFSVAHAARYGEGKPNLTWALAAGGLLYSAKTVWQWGRLTFDDPWKATGFVVLIEGVMIASPYDWLSEVALGYLLVINAIATACLLAGRDERDKRANGVAEKVASAALGSKAPIVPMSNALPAESHTPADEWLIRDDERARRDQSSDSPHSAAPKALLRPNTALGDDLSARSSVGLAADKNGSQWESGVRAPSPELISNERVSFRLPDGVGGSTPASGFEDCSGDEADRGGLETSTGGVDAPDVDRFVADASDPEAHTDTHYIRALALAEATLAEASGSFSISLVKRELGVGWNRASQLVAQLEQDGLIPPRPRKTRLVAVTGRAALAS